VAIPDISEQNARDRHEPLRGSRDDCITKSDSHPLIPAYNIVYKCAVCADMQRDMLNKELQNRRLVSSLTKLPGRTTRGIKTDRIDYAIRSDMLAGLLNQPGIPVGQMIELTGPPSSGKTSLLFYLLSLLPNKSDIAYLDLNHSFFPAAAVRSGIDLYRLWLINPADSSQAIREAEKILEQQPSTIVLDLVGSHTPLPHTLTHRLRIQTVRQHSLVIFLTETDPHITSVALLPTSTVSLKLHITRLGTKEIAIEIAKSRLGCEGRTMKVRLP